MVIKIYISGSSGNKEVKKRQQRVLLILDSKNVKYEIIDIAEPGAEEAKDFMQNNSTSLGATIGDPSPRHALPPQIFNDGVYCGDYDMFDMANEIDEMEVFLKLEPNSLNEQISTFETKLKNGDLSIDEKIDKVIGAKIDDEIIESEQDKVQEDDNKEENEKEGNVKEENVEINEDKEESAEKNEGNKEESAEQNEEDKEGSPEKEVDTKEESEGEDIGKEEVDKEDKSEKNEDNDAAGDKTDENSEDEKDNDEKEELEKEASPEKSE